MKYPPDLEMDDTDRDATPPPRSAGRKGYSVEYTALDFDKPRKSEP